MRFDDNNNNIIVSVFCLAYNHEKFIRQTLDGFVMQKTSFRFEVLVHDDASTDSTADIIREYEKKYPDIIKPVYQTTNQYSRNVGIIKNILYPEAKGKYFAWCEGDDYWTDPLKLQRQAEALDSNPNCSACFHKVAYMSINGHLTGKVMPYLPDGERIIQSKEYIDYILYPAPAKSLPWQLSGFMIKREALQAYLASDLPYRKIMGVGDIPLFLYSGTQGPVYYIDRVMSNYRTGNPNSWVGISKSSIKNRLDWYQKKAEGIKAFDEYTEFQFHNSAVKGIRNCHFLAAQRVNDIKTMKSEEMSEIYRTLSIYNKAAHYFLHYFPRFEKPARTIISVIRKNK